MQIVSPLSLFQNPMILLAVAALGLTFGMPKLMENSAFPLPAPFNCDSFLLSKSTD